MILDAGCGPDRVGNVGIDLYNAYTPQSLKAKYYDWGAPIDRGEYFVVGDIQSLPFRSKCFEGVFCFHVLEHLHRPYQALRELCRVSNGFVEIEVPHRLSRSQKGPPQHHHVTSFNYRWFRDAAARLNVKIIRPILGWQLHPPLFIGNIRVVFRVGL